MNSTTESNSGMGVAYAFEIGGATASVLAVIAVMYRVYLRFVRTSCEVTPRSVVLSIVARGGTPVANPTSPTGLR